MDTLRKPIFNVDTSAAIYCNSFKHKVVFYDTALNLNSLKYLCTFSVYRYQGKSFDTQITILQCPFYIKLLERYYVKKLVKMT